MFTILEISTLEAPTKINIQTIVMHAFTDLIEADEEMLAKLGDKGFKISREESCIFNQRNAVILLMWQIIILKVIIIYFLIEPNVV